MIGNLQVSKRAYQNITRVKLHFHMKERMKSTSVDQESPRIQTTLTSLSSYPEPPDTKPHRGQQHSHSSSSSFGPAGEMTQALTLTTKQSQGTSNRHGPGTGNRRVESSEEGGSSEAPPASVFFGILDEGAEQAEKWNSGSDTDLRRPDRSRARYTRKYLSSILFLYFSQVQVQTAQHAVNNCFKVE